MGRFLDWLADRVQAESGEKERRQLVQELKAAAYAFKETIEKAISQLNVVIEKFNAAIKNLNQRRQGKTKQNIETLHAFLSKFGQCKVPLHQKANGFRMISRKEGLIVSKTI